MYEFEKDHNLVNHMLIPVAAGHDDQQQNNGSTDNKYRDLPKERDGSDELVEENP